MLLETPVIADRLERYLDHYADKGMQLPTSVYKVFYAGQSPKVQASYWLLQQDGSRKALRLDTITLHSQLNSTFRKARETQIQSRLAGTTMRLYVGDDAATATAVKQDTSEITVWSLIFSTDSAAEVYR